MPDRSVAVRATPARLREARRQLLDTGDVARDQIGEALRGSWQRSRRFGLVPTGRTPGAPHASAAQLARALDQQRVLLSHARPVMEFLFDQTCHTDGMVILADAQGMLLQALGDASFTDRAQRVALRPGANWHERWRGTNAIGTALADEIEHKLFDTHHGASLRLHLHAQPEGIGTVTEGLLALSDDGWIIGANASALEMLGFSRNALASQTLESVLQLDLGTLFSWAGAARGAPRLVRRLDGSALWARAEGGRVAVAAAVAGTTAPRVRPPQQDDALAALDTGDASMCVAIGRARRVLDKPIALLLQGESGVGKEVFARALHASSERRAGPFVAVNCAALPEALIESELFGYRAGAFTGAGREGAPGRIREAHRGTLFLDEIGDMPLALQPRLLRLLQDRQVQPLGGGAAVAVDFRLVCATHRDLRQLMDQGRFREDLYYRLNGLALQLPPLRERQDSAQLMARMLREFAPDRELHFAPGLAVAMAAYRWPGNLRQLNNALQTACALLDEGEVIVDWMHVPDDLARDLRGATVTRAPGEAGADLRAQAVCTVRQVVDSCGGNLSEAARRLGISRNTLYRKLREMGAAG